MCTDLENRLISARPRIGPDSDATARAKEAALASLPPPQTSHPFLRPTYVRRVALAAAAAVVIAAPAYAIGTHAIDFWSGRPASTVIMKRFNALFVRGAPPRMNPHAITADTRLVTVFKFDGDSFPLWVAPTTSGSVCAEFVGFAGGCTSAGPQPSGSLNPIFGTVNHRTFVAGIITASAAIRLELVFSDGATEPLNFVWVSDPIDAGFFMTTLEESGRAQPLALRLLDAAGRVLSETDLQSSTGPRGAP